MLILSLVFILVFTGCNNMSKRDNVKIVYLKEAPKYTEKKVPCKKLKKIRISKSGAYDFKNVKYLYNYDGDTITFNILDTHPLLGNKIAVRVAEIDTPEKRTKNKCEKEKAKEAQKLVESILKVAKHISLKGCSRGKYFRIVCHVLADRIDISTLLLSKGLAVAYYGGHKETVNWCKK